MRPAAEKTHAGGGRLLLGEIQVKLLSILVVAAALAGTGVAYAQDAAPENKVAVAVKTAELPTPPVIAGDISDRPYTVLGQITAGVRKATVFSKAASPEKIYRELWERGKKMGADAVVHAEFGEAHISALSWGQTTATGIAVKFDPPVVPAVQQ